MIFNKIIHSFNILKMFQNNILTMKEMQIKEDKEIFYKKLIKLPKLNLLIFFFTVIYILFIFVLINYIYKL